MAKVQDVSGFIGVGSYYKFKMVIGWIACVIKLVVGAYCA